MLEYFDELEADFQEYYNLDVSLVARPRAARLLFQLPRPARTYVRINPAAQWGWEELFLNRIAFYLETLVWAKSKDATKKAPLHRPKLFTPDFMPQHSEPGQISKGAEVHTTDEIDRILKMRRV